MPIREERNFIWLSILCRRRDCDLRKRTSDEMLGGGVDALEKQHRAAN
jgi:hypothetical protein